MSQRQILDVRKLGATRPPSNRGHKPNQAFVSISVFKQRSRESRFPLIKPFIIKLAQLDKNQWCMFNAFNWSLFFCTAGGESSMAHLIEHQTCNPALLVQSHLFFTSSDRIFACPIIYTLIHNAILLIDTTTTSEVHLLIGTPCLAKIVT